MSSAVFVSMLIIAFIPFLIAFGADIVERIQRSSRSNKTVAVGPTQAKIDSSFFWPEYESRILQLRSELKKPLSEIVLEAERKAITEFQHDWDIPYSELGIGPCTDHNWHYRYSSSTFESCSICGAYKDLYESKLRDKRILEHTRKLEKINAGGHIKIPNYYTL